MAGSDHVRRGRRHERNGCAGGCNERSVRMTIGLAFLNPVIVKAAINGTSPAGSGAKRLVDLPADWRQQAETIALE